MKKGNIYFFEVNENRDGILFTKDQQNSGLSDHIVNSEEELSRITFGTGFGDITDIDTGPDGFLYILSFYKEGQAKPYGVNNNGTIYRISPKNTSQ